MRHLKVIFLTTLVVLIALCEGQGPGEFCDFILIFQRFGFEE